MSDNNGLTYTAYVKNVVPNMISHVTNPIYRIVELALMGRYSSKNAIGGLGISVTLMNTFDWVLSFFRLSVIKSSAIAYREGDERAQAKVLFQHMVLVVLVGYLLILLRDFIWNIAMCFYKPEVGIMQEAAKYFHIAMWGMPATLMNYMIAGWLFGREQGKCAVVLEVGVNLISIISSVLLVKDHHMGIEGLAMASITAQAVMLILGMGIILKKNRFVLKYINRVSIWNLKTIQNNILTESDIIVRTICTVVVANVVMATSSHLGSMILITNTIIMQLKDVIAYFFEGLATTIRGFSVRSKQEENKELLRELHKMALVSVMYLSIGIDMVYKVGRIKLIGFITPSLDVRQSFLTYDGWLSMYPIVAGWGLSAYGLYVALTQTKSLKNMYSIAFGVFWITYAVALPILGNHGLWLAFISFYLVRSIGLLAYEGHLYS